MVMKNKWIVIFLVVLGVIIVAVIAGDFISTRPDKQSGNPYALNIDAYKDVDPKLIIYKEVKNYEVQMDSVKGIAYSNGIIYLAGDQKVQVIDKYGKLLNSFPLSGMPTCIQAGKDKIVVGLRNRIAVFSPEGVLVSEWSSLDSNSVVTSIAIKGNLVFIADAGKRKVYRYLITGEKLGEIEGKTSSETLHGFIVPSPNFDVAVNPDGDLWIVNPGNHSLENYSETGVFKGFWKSSSMKIEGFTGCCNPAHFTFLPNGNFVTCEKGLVRIKIYRPSGEFVGVVAPTSAFKDESHAADVASDEEGNVYALDFEKKLIRVFEPKQK
jgi:hypothetical protein